MRELLSMIDVAENLPHATKDQAKLARSFVVALQVPTMRVGKRLFVRRADLAKALSIAPDAVVTT